MFQWAITNSTGTNAEKYEMSAKKYKLQKKKPNRNCRHEKCNSQS